MAFQDLNTDFKAYITTLKNAAPTAQDVTTLVIKDQPTQRAKSAEAAKDLNTAYEKGIP